MFKLTPIRLTLALGALPWLPLAHALEYSVTVPGTADPWLAGMPDGASASYYNDGIQPGGSIVPDNSPVLVPIQNLGRVLSIYFDADGLAANTIAWPLTPPEGYVWYGAHHHWAGAENGISDIVAPLNSLLGVFLTQDQPNLKPAPGTLQFGTSAERDFPMLEPDLQQVFFIGDGFTSEGLRQQIVVPDGATRLYLGMLDTWGYFNNVGSYEVNYLVRVGQGDCWEHRVADPGSTLLLLSLGLAAGVGLRRGLG